MQNLFLKSYMNFTRNSCRAMVAYSWPTPWLATPAPSSALTTPHSSGRDNPARPSKDDRIISDHVGEDVPNRRCDTQIHSKLCPIPL